MWRLLHLLIIDKELVASHLQIVSGETHTALDVVIPHIDRSCHHLAKGARVAPDPIPAVEVTEGIVVRIGHLERDGIPGGKVEDYQFVPLEMPKSSDPLVGELRIVDVGLLPIPRELIMHQGESERSHRQSRSKAKLGDKEVIPHEGGLLQ